MAQDWCTAIDVHIVHLKICFVRGNTLYISKKFQEFHVLSYLICTVSILGNQGDYYFAEEKM